MMYSLPGYDAWLTTPPEPEWGVCPDCGCSQEDCDELPSGEWECPECGCLFTDEDAQPDYDGYYEEEE